MSFMRAMRSGRHVLHALGHLVEVALHELLAQLVHQLLEPLARRVVHEVVLLQRLHLAGEVGGQLVELLAPLLGEVFDDLLAALVAGLDAPRRRGGRCPRAPARRPRAAARRSRRRRRRGRSGSSISLPPLAELLQHLAQAHELLAVAVLEALLHQPSQRGVEIAVVEEVVGHLVEQRRRRRGRSPSGSRPSAEYRNPCPSCCRRRRSRIRPRYPATAERRNSTECRQAATRVRTDRAIRRPVVSLPRRRAHDVARLPRPVHRSAAAGHRTRARRVRTMPSRPRARR